MTRIFGFAVLLLGIALPVSATPMTWTFTGTVNGGAIREIPDETPITVAWTFDDATAGHCYFTHQSVSVQIDSPRGPLTYQATGFLLSDARLDAGCVVAQSDMELRLPWWSGPVLPDARLDPYLLAYPGGLFWQDAGLQGAFPAMQPQTVRFISQPFDLPYQSGDTTEREQSLTTYLTAMPPQAFNRTVSIADKVPTAEVPEPVSLLLVAAGLIVLVCRKVS